MNLSLKLDIDPTDLRQAVADHLINIAHDIVGKPYDLKPVSPAADLLPNFVKIGANGQELPDTATNHVAVLVRSRNIWITAKKISPKRLDWEDAETACKALHLCGCRDWQLPELADLEAIRDLTKCDPAVDTNFFPGLDSASHWSRTPYAGNPSSDAWSLNFDVGGVNTDSRNLECFVLAVRPASPPSQ